MTENQSETLDELPESGEFQPKTLEELLESEEINDKIQVFELMLEDRIRSGKKGKGPVGKIIEAQVVYRRALARAVASLQSVEEVAKDFVFPYFDFSEDENGYDRTEIRAGVPKFALMRAVTHFAAYERSGWLRADWESDMYDPSLSDDKLYRVVMDRIRGLLFEKTSIRNHFPLVTRGIPSVDGKTFVAISDSMNAQGSLDYESVEDRYEKIEIVAGTFALSPSVPCFGVEEREALSAFQVAIAAKAFSSEDYGKTISLVHQVSVGCKPLVCLGSTKAADGTRFAVSLTVSAVEAVIRAFEEAVEKRKGDLYESSEFHDLLRPMEQFLQYVSFFLPVSYEEVAPLGRLADPFKTIWRRFSGVHPIIEMVFGIFNHLDKMDQSNPRSRERWDLSRA